MGAIIWLASYPKSGNTWMRVFLHNLLTNAREPIKINALNRFCLGEDRAEYYNHFDPRPLGSLPIEEVMALRLKVQELLTQSSPDSVFVKTHNLLGLIDGVPTVNREATAGAIYLLRNPLDIAVSYAHHYGLTIDETIAQLADPDAGSANTDLVARNFYGTWTMHVQSWTQDPSASLHVVRYEDLVARPGEAFGGVARFLGLDPPAERLERAIAFSAFDVVRGQEQEGGFVERSQHSRFFREGRANQWREVLTDAQVAKVVADHRDQMARFGYLPEGA